MSAQEATRKASETLAILKEHIQANSKIAAEWKKPDRIAYCVSHSFPFSSNGYAIRTHDIASALTELNHSVVVLSRPGRPWDLPGFKEELYPETHCIDKVRYIHFKNPSSKTTTKIEYLKQATTTLYENLCVLKPSAIIAASNWENALPALIASEKLKIPFFYEVRGFWEITQASQQPNYNSTDSFKEKIALETLVATSAKHIFTLNKSMEDELINRGIEKSKISIARNGSISAKSSNLSHSAAKNKLKSKSKYLVGYIGSFSNYEGLELLIRACAINRQQGLDIDLVLVGSSNPLGITKNITNCAETQRLKKVAETLNFSEHLITTGRVAPENLADIYAAIDLIVIPRLPVEVAKLVSPLKPYEAAAYGKTILLSDVKALREISSELSNCTLFEAGSVENLTAKIKHTFSNQEFSSAIKSNANKINPEFTWKQAAEAISQKIEPLQKKQKFSPTTKLTQTHIQELILNKSSTTDTIHLSTQPISTELPILDQSPLVISIPITYKNIDPAEQKKAVLTIDFKDNSNISINPPYKGFAKSDIVGMFKYIYPKNNNSEINIELHPPTGAALAKIELRTFNTKKDEQVIVANRLKITNINSKSIINKNLITHKTETHAHEIHIEKVTKEEITLKQNPSWVEINLTEDDYLKISCNIKYNHISQNEKRKAIVVAEYLDENNEKIASKYPGFTLSKDVGWFKYLAPQKNSHSDYIEVIPPARAKKIKLGFRAFNTKANEQVTISNRLKLDWLNNNTQDNNEEQQISWLPFEGPQTRSVWKPTIASIMDPFSHACFEPEGKLISITPQNWRNEILLNKIDFILVESAWHGNNDSWLYRVASFKNPPGDELKEILKWAKKYDIPTVFWNKEDPPNFDRFINRASEFDYIFTTDENCIEKYRKVVGQEKFIGSLPFAAQPKIHNTHTNNIRLNSCNFAGTYYADDFEPRRKSMDMLLRTAARYGLDIYDRMHEVTGKEKIRFTFPSDLQKHIKGSLSYKQMLEAYRQYRVALNVNSVTDSPTMFSRRVFELLACGTPVISTQSLGINKIFGEIVPTIESAEEAEQCFNRLMTDANEWLKASILGTRSVFTNHTYAHRMAEITKTIGIKSKINTKRDVIAIILPEGDPKKLSAVLSQQAEPISTAIVLKHPKEPQAQQDHLIELKKTIKNAISMPTENIASFIKNRHPDASVILLDSSLHYGPSYTLDAGISLEGADETIITSISSKLATITLNKKLEFKDINTLGMPTTHIELNSCAFLATNKSAGLMINEFSSGKKISAIPSRSRPPIDFIG